MYGKRSVAHPRASLQSREAHDQNRYKPKTVEFPFVPPQEVPTAPIKRRVRRPRMAEDEFQNNCMKFMRYYVEQHEMGLNPRVGKAFVQFVMRRRGYAPSHLDRKWRKCRGYERYYDPDFPKPIDEAAYRLEWSFEALLDFRGKKYGK